VPNQENEAPPSSYESYATDEAVTTKQKLEDISQRPKKRSEEAVQASTLDPDPNHDRRKRRKSEDSDPIPVPAPDTALQAGEDELKPS
jgi:hypothetical protein